MGGFGVYRGWKQQAAREAIRSAPTTDVLSITPGPVEVVGTAKPTEDGVVSATFSDDDCLIAEWKIEEYDEAGKHSSWNTVGSGVVSKPFFVDDGSDEALVRPEGARLDVEGTAERTVEVAATEDPPEPIRTFLDLESTPGQPDEPLLSSRERSASQCPSSAGERGAVGRTVAGEGPPETGGRDVAQPPGVTRPRSSRRHPLVRPPPVLRHHAS